MLSNTNRLLTCLLCLLCSAVQLLAVINPALQPDVYFDKYDNVLVLRLNAIDDSTATLQCTVVETLKGAYTNDQSINITFSGALAGQITERSESGRLQVGDEFPVFAGKPSRRKSKRQVRLYIDEFFVGEVNAADQFTIGIADEMETDSEGGQVNTLAGIYCGMTSELTKMLRQMAEGTDYYPRKAYVKFKQDLLIDELEGSVEGIAMFDLNGDGMEDIVACSPSGDRIYQQVEPMKFSHVSESIGIRSASVSCSAADVDCDGLADLLLGTTIYQGRFEKGYQLKATDWLSLADSEGLKSAAFVELNGDGYPDIIASYTGDGLRAFLNPGAAKGAFSDVTEALGLPLEGNGYITAGDWNGDQRTDLFYAAGRGILLIQQAGGSFQEQPHQVDFSFRTGVDTYGQTGAGVFMPTYLTDQMDLVVPIEKDWLVVTDIDGTPTDITHYGNEISEGSDYHLATAYADLNVDGYMDIYTIADQEKENRFIINRGYGSYMHAKVHVDEKPLFKGPAHASGGRSLALGDINADGAPDILIGNAQGQILLVVNDTLSMRQAGELLKKDQKRLLDVRVCAVRVLGPKGVIGAKVRLIDASGAVVIRKDIGSNTATGCTSPDQVCLAVRAPGSYKLQVTYADNYQREWDVDLNAKQYVSIVAQRADQEDNNDVW